MDNGQLTIGVGSLAKVLRQFRVWRIPQGRSYSKKLGKRAKELDLKDLSFLREWKEQINFMESLILAQDERWRRA